MVKPFTPEQMVQIRAFAPFEIVEVMTEWQQRWGSAKASDLIHPMDDDQAIGITRHACDGLGPPFRNGAESYEEFGLRVATAIFTLIKEI